MNWTIDYSKNLKEWKKETAIKALNFVCLKKMDLKVMPDEVLVGLFWSLSSFHMRWNNIEVENKTEHWIQHPMKSYCL